MRVAEIAKKVRSKNAGPFWVTVDIFCGTAEAYARLVKALPTPVVAQLYGQPEQLVKRFDIADLNVIYLDTAAYNTGDGHLNLGKNPALLKLFGGLVGIADAFTADARARVGLLPGLVLTVRNATEIVLRPVGAIAEGSQRTVGP